MAEKQGKEALIDSIYEAATLPHAWPAAIDGLREYFNARAAGLYMGDEQAREAFPVRLSGILCL